MRVYGIRYTVDGRRWGRVVLFAVICLLFAVHRPPSAHAQCTPPSDGLIAHWKLDESGATTTAADSSGVANADGTLLNFADPSAAWLPSGGEVGGTLEFAGDNDVIDMTGSGGAGHALDLTSGPFTISAWIYPDAYDGTIIAKRDGVVANAQYQIFIPPSGAVYFMANGEWGGSTATVPLSQWSFVTAVVDENNNPEVYINGIKQPWADSTGTRPYSFAHHGTDVSIGARYNAYPGVTKQFDGKIDDVRIYNRALSADEIAALYATRSTVDAPAGQMVYDARHARMMYCNGTGWVNAGIGSYNPNAVNFDGTNDYLETPSMTGMIDSDKVSISLWVRPHLQGTDTDQILFENTAGSFQIAMDTEGTNDNKYAFYFSNLDSDLNDVALIGTSETITPGNWYHFLFSADTAAGVSNLYVNGVLDEALDSSNIGTIAIAGGPFAVGSATGGGDKAAADIADLWIDVGDYIDFSNESNRRKFRSPNGLPAYLGEDGSLPTGSKPDIFLSGDTVNFQSNKGTGGGFTENGALTTASSQPGDSVISGDDITSDLIGWWKLNETSGTLADSAGNNDGTASGSPVYAAAGAVDYAMQFDGVDDKVDLGTPAALDDVRPFTISAWVYPNASTKMSIFTSDGMADGDGYGFYLNLTGTNTLAFFADTSGADGFYESLNNSIELNQWQHVAVTWDGTVPVTAHLYINGVETGYATTTGGSGSPPADSANSKLIGAHPVGDWFNGAIDDVHIYSRVLSDEEIATLYGKGFPGKLHYNDDFHVMEYFNGAEWVAMGPVGGTPPTNGLVGHWKLDETSGTTAVDSAGNNDGTMANGLDAGTASVAGAVGSGLEFDGVDDYVSLGNPASLQLTGAMAISAWVYLDDFDDQSRIISKNGSSSDRGWELNMENASTTGNNEVQFLVAINSTTTAAVYSGAIIPTGKWIHLAGVYEPGVAVRLYLDGTLVASDTTGIPAAQRNSTVNVEIGKKPGSSDYWDGKLDDIRVYNRALSPHEVAELYHYGLSHGLGGTSADCTNPAMPEGAMVYNTDYNVMQYCNGEHWIGVGQ